MAEKYLFYKEGSRMQTFDDWVEEKKLSTFRGCGFCYFTGDSENGFLYEIKRPQPSDNAIFLTFRLAKEEMGPEGIEDHFTCALSDKLSIEYTPDLSKEILDFLLKRPEMSICLNAMRQIDRVRNELLSNLGISRILEFSTFGISFNVRTPEIFREFLEFLQKEDSKLSDLPNLSKYAVYPKYII